MFTPLTLTGCQLDPRDGRVVSAWTETGGARRFLLWMSERDAAVLYGEAPSGGPLSTRLVATLGGDIITARLVGLDTRGVVSATLVLEQAGREMVVAASASEAIVTAFASGAPIEIRDDLLSEVSRHIDAAEARAELERASSSDAAVPLSTGERWNQLLSHLGPLGSTAPIA